MMLHSVIDRYRTWTLISDAWVEWMLSLGALINSTRKNRIAYQPFVGLNL